MRRGSTASSAATGQAEQPQDATDRADRRPRIDMRGDEIAPDAIGAEGKTEMEAVEAEKDDRPDNGEPT